MTRAKEREAFIYLKELTRRKFVTEREYLQTEVHVFQGCSVLQGIETKQLKHRIFSDIRPP